MTDATVNGERVDEMRTITKVSEIANMELVEVGDDTILVVAPPHFSEPQNRNVELRDADLAVGAEIGTTQSSFTTFAREEYNSELRGHEGLRKYDRMRRNDGAVYSALLAAKTPIKGAKWYVQSASPEPQAKEIADFVHKNLTKWMTYSWPRVLSEALLKLDFGYYMFEKVWAIRNIDGIERVYLKKLAARHPLDVIEWHFDRHGGPRMAEMESIDGETPVQIPIDKLVVFTHDHEAGDLRGRSVLRSAYKHWFYAENAYKIDGIQKERHGIGIPIITLPVGFSKSDKELAHEIGRNLRTNESAHVVLPVAWEIIFAKLEGQPVSALETAVHHSRMIYKNLLLDALWGTSSDGAATAQQLMFYKSSRYTADVIADTINSWVIPQLVDFNWFGIEEYPELRVRKLGDIEDSRTNSFSARNYVGAGIIIPDEDLEAWARQDIDAPRADPATRRDVEAPQDPNSKKDDDEGDDEKKSGQAGPSRQSQAKNQKQKQGGNAGNDKSGGK